MYDEPQFFYEMHELESGKARYSIPAHVSTDGDESTGGDEITPTSSRKRAVKKKKEAITFEDLNDKMAIRHEKKIEELRS